jgi:uncharacterized membrane protein
MAGVNSGHRLLDRTFFVSVVIKGFDGLLELVGGILLFMVKPDRINAATRFLTQHEIDQDPHDFIDTHLRTLTAHLSLSTTLFDAAYLLIHGIVKMVLVWAVLRGHVRAYPWMIGFLVAFIGFQLYELAHVFSAGLVLLTLFDAFIVVLTWREYRIKKAERGRAAKVAETAV